MFTIAHLSDPHLGLVAAPRLRELAGKRMTGFINLARNRARNHQAWVLDALIDDLRQHEPDHVAVTGDLVNIALRSEFVRAREWLENLGPPQSVSLVPGNHDAYVDMPLAAGMGQWAAYMQGDDATDDDLHFPYLRRRGKIAIIGVSSAVTSAPLMATGRVGSKQRHRLGEMLKDLADQDLYRVLLIHHPPVPGAAARHKRLTDVRKFAVLIARHGAELILHGHNHTDTLLGLAGPAGMVPVIGVPAASSVGQDRNKPAQYNLFRIETNGSQPTCLLVARQLDPRSRTFVTAFTRQLDAQAFGHPNLQLAMGTAVTVA